jgi:molybdopterin molybdotransferase
MIEVADALTTVLLRCVPRPAEPVPLSQALGRILAEEVRADLDAPPYDKAVMDGYAVVAADLAGGSAEMCVLEEVTAGQMPVHPVTAGRATRIMTGAPLPPGADAVVVMEHATLIGPAEAPRVRIEETGTSVGQNILARGAVMRRGEVLWQPGRVLSPIDVGLLAEVGRTRVLVCAQPRVAVLVTGNELVPVEQVPTGGQIRNSNGPMLSALVSQCGGQVIDLGISRDDEAELAGRIVGELPGDVLLLSGGVSAGVLDLVPKVLERLGVEKVFHKVRLKPGKPLWFGTANHGGHTSLVFGLPGNPVSCLVCFELFVRPALAALVGLTASNTRACSGRLVPPHAHRGNRPSYLPARLRYEGEQVLVEPLAWHGSADLRTLADADCLAVFPAGQQEFPAGTVVEIHPLQRV